MLDVFGDESAGEDFVSYAFVCIPSDEAAALGDQIEALKARYGLAKLHCRILFSPNQRLKAGLGPLTTPQVISIYEELVGHLTSPNLRIVAARLRMSDFPKEQAASDGFPRVVNDSKTMGIFCANAAIAPLKRDFTQVPMRIWPDHDGTKTEWLGKNQPASQAIGMFYDIDGIRDERVRPAPLAEMPDDARRSLFDVADLAAWLSNRAATGKNSNLHGPLMSLYAQLRPMEVRGRMGPRGAMSFTVPNEWPARPG
jgi:hypothetical protein